MTELLEVTLLDESAELTLGDLCAVCSVTEEVVLEIVAEGIVEPVGAGPSEWRFSGVALTRVRRVLRLQRDFGVNVPGAALALVLLDEVERLRRASVGGQ